MDSSKPQVFFLRKHDRTPIGAMALQKYGEHHRFAKVAVSICHPSDAWNRATARNKALGRLNARDSHRGWVVSSPSHLDGVTAILQRLGAARVREVDLDAAQKTFDRLLDFVTR